MKAIVCKKYGSPDVLELRDIPKPTVSEKQILVKVHASSATRADCMMREGKPYFARLFLGLTKPKVTATGTGFAGVVEAVGSEVSAFKKGDRIFGETLTGFGSNAEYVSVSEDALILHIPESVSYEDACCICDGPLTSYSFLKDLAKVKTGDSVLINGASGSLGLAAIQIAKSAGATVTAVCSGKNEELVRSVGADLAVDYTKTDFTSFHRPFDIIYDTLGGSSFSRCKLVLRDKGTYLSTVLSGRLLWDMIRTAKASKRAVFSATGARSVSELKPFMVEIVKAFEQGSIKAVLDRTYPLEQAKEAHRYIETGRKRGNVILNIT